MELNVPMTAAAPHPTRSPNSEVPNINRKTCSAVEKPSTWVIMLGPESACALGHARAPRIRFPVRESTCRLVLCFQANEALRNCTETQRTPPWIFQTKVELVHFCRARCSKGERTEGGSRSVVRWRGSCIVVVGDKREAMELFAADAPPETMQQHVSWGATHASYMVLLLTESPLIGRKTGLNVAGGFCCQHEGWGSAITTAILFILHKHRGTVVRTTTTIQRVAQETFNTATFQANKGHSKRAHNSPHSTSKDSVPGRNRNSEHTGCVDRTPEGHKMTPTRLRFATSD